MSRALSMRPIPAAENVNGGTEKEQTQAHRVAPDEPDAPRWCL